MATARISERARRLWPGDKRSLATLIARPALAPRARRPNTVSNRKELWPMVRHQSLASKLIISLGAVCVQMSSAPAWSQTSHRDQADQIYGVCNFETRAGTRGVRVTIDPREQSVYTDYFRNLVVEQVIGNRYNVSRETRDDGVRYGNFYVAWSAEKEEWYVSRFEMSAVFQSGREAEWEGDCRPMF